MAPGVELRNRKLGDRTKSDKQTCQQAKKPTTSSRESDKNKSLLPKVTTKTPTDLNAKSKVFVRDVVEFLYEKVFLNGEDTLKLEESSDHEKNATSTMIKNTGGQLLVHDDDASKNAAQWLQALLPPDGAGGGESECEQAEDRKAYAKRVQSRSKQQLYVDWVRAVLDSRYGAGWHVLFGRDMGFAMRYRKGSLGMFSIGDKVRVIVYKSGPKGTALHNNRLLATRPPEVKAAATTTGDAAGGKSSPTVPAKVQVVDWYGYCEEEWEDDAKSDGLAAESSDGVPAADLQKQDLERKERRAKILAYAKAKNRFEPCIAALTSAVAFWDDDSAKFARSVRYRLTKQTIMDSIDVAGAASSTSSSTSPSGSAAADEVPEPQPEVAASSTSAAAPARTSSSSTSEDSRDPLLPCRPDPDCSWHCYTGSDFVASTAVTVQNQITALLKKRRVLVFQHCSPDDVVRFSPLQIAKEVVSDGQMFMKVLPYLALFFVGVWYFGRRILCMDHAGGQHAVTQNFLITTAHAVDAEELVRQTFGNRRFLIKPSVREWIGGGGAGSLDSVFCEVDLENSGALTYVAGFFLAMMVARNVAGKLAKNATGGPGKRR